MKTKKICLGGVEETIPLHSPLPFNLGSFLIENPLHSLELIFIPVGCEFKHRSRSMEIHHEAECGA
jgi:hypothetical protein